MKRLLLLLLTLCLLTGCVGKTVVQNDPAVPNTDTNQPDETAVKTGLALLTTISKSMNATPDSKGSARTDTTVVAVTVDGDGIIRACAIDGITAAVPFDTEGELEAEEDTAYPTKNELGDDYGMHKASPIGREWDEQAADFAAWVVGKRAEELEGGDVTASVTISTDDFIRAIRSAADTTASACTCSVIPSGSSAGQRRLRSAIPADLAPPLLPLLPPDIYLSSKVRISVAFSGSSHTEAMASSLSPSTAQLISRRLPTARSASTRGE